MQETGAAAVGPEGYWTDRAAATEATPAGAARFPEKTWIYDAWAVAEALFTREEGPPPLDRLAWVTRDLEDFLEGIGPRSRLVFRGCLAAVTWVGPILSLKVPPLRIHSAHNRAEAIERMERGPLAMAVLGVKATLSLLWYEHPRSAREIGFDGRCRGSAP
jgi:hypothetical protein